MTISIKDEQGIAGMRLAGRLASEVLDFLTPHVQAGITTNALDKLAHDYITEVQQAIPAPLNYAPNGYNPYPKSICTSVNQVVCHGIPGAKKLKNGDILNIDITVIKDGFHGDTSRMFYAGEPSLKATRLVDVTFECLMLGIEAASKPGARLGDIGAAIEAHANQYRYGVVREFCGHGLGRTRCEHRAGRTPQPLDDLSASHGPMMDSGPGSSPCVRCSSTRRSLSA